jgi:hypothetical protein
MSTPLGSLLQQVTRGGGQQAPQQDSPLSQLLGAAPQVPVPQPLPELTKRQFRSLAALFALNPQVGAARQQERSAQVLQRNAQIERAQSENARLKAQQIQQQRLLKEQERVQKRFSEAQAAIQKRHEETLRGINERHREEQDRLRERFDKEFGAKQTKGDKPTAGQINRTDSALQFLDDFILADISGGQTVQEPGGEPFVQGRVIKDPVTGEELEFGTSVIDEIAAGRTTLEKEKKAFAREVNRFRTSLSPEQRKQKIAQWEAEVRRGVQEKAQRDASLGIPPRSIP